MKKLSALIILALLLTPTIVFAEAPGETVINHNETFIGWDINKKTEGVPILGAIPFVDRITLSTRKTVWTNLFGSQWEQVGWDNGWYGGVIFKTDLN